MTVTIIGAGEMASAIALTLYGAGVPVRILARRLDAADALAGTIGAHSGRIVDGTLDDTVVLAVPSHAVLDVVALRGADFGGRVIVDASNPYDPVTLRPIASTDASLTETIQRALPTARVVKAFGTVSASALRADDPGEGYPVVLVAADDASARAEILMLLHRCDLAAAPVGSLERSAELDAMAHLQALLTADGMISRAGGFALRY